MGKPIYPIEVFCKGCNTLLYKYDKEGPGGLIKCFVDRIKVDNTGGTNKCPKCGREFARPGTILNRPIMKIIGDRVYIKGHCKK